MDFFTTGFALWRQVLQYLNTRDTFAFRTVNPAVCLACQGGTSIGAKDGRQILGNQLIASWFHQRSWESAHVLTTQSGDIVHGCLGMSGLWVGYESTRFVVESCQPHLQFDLCGHFTGQELKQINLGWRVLSMNNGSEQKGRGEIKITKWENLGEVNDLQRRFKALTILTGFKIISNFSCRSQNSI